jgi:tetratricopeptide (TPR) repeat protein
MSLHAIAMRHVRLCCILLPLLGAGCADLRPDGEPARPGAPGQAGYEDVSKAAATLLEGIRLYENGNFKEAIAAFGAPDVQAAPAAIRVDALKYSAFSYCVLENYAQCRHAFDLALGLDPDFALRSSERGHPMWGPVFDAAKATSEQGRTHTSLDRERERWRGVDLWRAR